MACNLTANSSYFLNLLPLTTIQHDKIFMWYFPEYIVVFAYFSTTTIKAVSSTFDRESPQYHELLVTKAITTTDI